MKKRISLILLLCLLLTACGREVQAQEETDYLQAQTLLEQGDYENAKARFTALGNYRDSRYLLSEIAMAQAYEAALGYLQTGDYPNAYVALCELSGYKDVDTYLARFQTVEVNPDNWEDFFEFVEIPTITQNTAGEYERLQIVYMFRMKEDVWSRVYDFSANEVQATIQCYRQMKNLLMNKETGAYTLEPFDDYVSNILDEKQLNVTIQADAQQTQIEETNTVKGEAIDGPYCWVDILRDFTVAELDGRLYLYQ